MRSLTQSIFVAILLCCSMTISAQMENIYLTKDSNLVVDKLYAGMLGGTFFSTDSLYYDKFISMRAGAMVTYKFNKYVELKSFGVYDITNTNTFFTHQYWVKILPSKKFNIQIGNMATLMTEQRPHPASGAGQFETWTESQMPGQALNVKVHYLPTKDIDIGAGVAYRNHGEEYNLMVKYGPVKISGIYEEKMKKFGAALTLDFSRVYNTLVWREDKVASNILVVSLGKKKDWQLFADTGYDLQKKELVRAESGILKTFESDCTSIKLKGLYGLGYRGGKNEPRAISAYLYIHL